MTNASTSPRAMIGGIPVFCAYDEIIPIAKAVPNPQNPNKHPDKQINLLAEIIKQQGWRAPITISTRSGYIVRGHGRLMAAKLLGVDSIPADFQNYESDAAEKADMIADNRIAEFSDLDEDILSALLEEINESDLDIELAGFDFSELDKFLADPGNLDDYAESYTSPSPSSVSPDPFYEGQGDAFQDTFQPPDPLTQPYVESLQKKQEQTGEIDIADYAEDKYTHECPKCKFKW